ncbi:hypothetical protein Micbo1qcDRAFT_231319 [Microdochium bolleyi]|uniref:Coenzyme Q-binding protein COQ10 START domain-containing protein n=1 Tax=Microdochium bolleyi TaxID=196109 RepID=A0A136JGI1_9PEZI|nr:hypothetical protein Micbo1qcDRAFT_231319 [Microdochium bolleyi]
MAGEVPFGQETAWVTPLPSPTVGGGGVSSITFSTHIAASPARCLEVALDPARYPEWNKFCRSAVIEKPAPASAIEGLDASLAFLTKGDGVAKEGLLLLGTEFCFKVYLDEDSENGRDTHLVVTVLEEIVHEGRKGFRVAWATRGGNWVQHAERTQDFIESADGKGTDYYNKETFYGVVSYAIKPFVGAKLVRALDLWRDGLKCEAEKS